MIILRNYHSNKWNNSDWSNNYCSSCEVWCNSDCNENGYCCENKTCHSCQSDIRNIYFIYFK